MMETGKHLFHGTTHRADIESFTAGKITDNNTGRLINASCHLRTTLCGRVSELAMYQGFSISILVMYQGFSIITLPLLSIFIP